MRLTVVYNAQGTILAAVETTGQYSGPLPVPSEGNKVGTFDVPETLSKKGLEAICLSFRVDGASQRLTETR